MRKYYVFAATHFLLTLFGWYFVAAGAQGAADGTGVAPAWLVAAHVTVLWLMTPLGRIGLWHDPFFGAATPGGIAFFALVALVNSAFVTSLLWAVVTAVQRHRGRRDGQDSDQELKIDR